MATTSNSNAINGAVGISQNAVKEIQNAIENVVLFAHTKSIGIGNSVKYDSIKGTISKNDFIKLLNNLQQKVDNATVGMKKLEEKVATAYKNYQTIDKQNSFKTSKF